MMIDMTRETDPSQIHKHQTRNRVLLGVFVFFLIAAGVAVALYFTVFNTSSNSNNMTGQTGFAQNGTAVDQLQINGGTCGSGSIGNGVCGTTGLCCSQYGWCGTGTAYCQSTNIGDYQTCKSGSSTCATSSFTCCVAPADVSTGKATCRPPSACASASTGGGTCGNGAIGNGKCADSTLCCSQYGYCGTGSQYCTQTQAPATTPAVVGTCGNGAIGNGKCADSGLCCSQYGYCGTGSQYCTQTQAPSNGGGGSNNGNIPNPFIGYYSWTYQGSRGPSGANVGIVFDGNNDIATVQSSYNSGSSRNIPYPAGALKMITIGGGGTSWSSSMVNGLANTVSQAKSDGYNGIVYDIEGTSESASTLIPAMNNLFAATKAAGLICVITSSHSAPFQTASGQDAVSIVTSWVGNSNVDIISPQFYSSGTETAPDTQESGECAGIGASCWSLYKNSKAIIVPSIVDVTHYAAVQSFMQQQGVTTKGYITWKQY